MALLFALLFIVLPILELALIVAAADAVGLGWTLLALVGLSVAGGWLMKREGFAVWRRASEEVAAGRAPTAQLLDGAMVLGGGALMLTPGFLTDAVGLLMLLPPVRALVRPLAVGWMARRAARATAMTRFRVVRMGGFGPTGGWGGPAGGPGRPGTGDPSSGTSGRPAEARVVDVEVHRPDSLEPGR